MDLENPERVLRGQRDFDGVLRRFFESLAGLSGDQGAREVLREAAEFVTEVPTAGRTALVDLDTPEDWSAWRAGRV